MSAQIDYSRYNNNRTIEEFLEDRILGCANNKPILNMCLTNGTMGRSDQKKLRQIYPGLFDAVQKFLSQKNHGKVFLYEEEGKPMVVNTFIHEKANRDEAVYVLRKSACKSIKAYVRNDKIHCSEFVWIYDDEGKHKKMIEDSIKWQFNYYYKFIALRPEERRQEEETDF